MAECRDVHDVRIPGMNDNSADVMRCGEPHFLPGLAAIDGFVCTVTPRGALPVVRLTGADPNDGGIGRRDGYIADGRDTLFVEDGLPSCPIVRGLPNSA